MNGNHQNKVLWWLLGAVLAPMVLTGATHTLTTVYANAQRVSALEVEVQDLRRHLSSIETKIDRLLER